MSIRGWLVALFVASCLAGTAGADELLYRYEADVVPYDKSAGWIIADACEGPCSESIEDGRFVLDWPENSGDSVNYALRISLPPDSPPPPPFWVEWQFRSNEPKHPNFFTCDARFSTVYSRDFEIFEPVWLFGDAVISFSGDEFVFGLAIDEFHSFRLETPNGREFRISVDGFVFRSGAGGPAGGASTTLQMGGGGGCSSNEPLATRNEWDFVRYGRITTGERIVTTDPPQGFLDPKQHTGLDRFTVTFDDPNYVYIDDIAVTVSDGVAPIVIQTRRLDNGDPETIQIVLDRPLPLDSVIRFDFLENDQVTNSVIYGQAPPIPAVSTWGIVVTLLGILTFGTLVFRGRSVIVYRAANEPSIAIDPTDPRRMAIGWRQFDSVESDFRQAGYGYSRSAGHQWTFPGVLEPGVFRSDPVLDSDAEGTFYYCGITGSFEGAVFKSLDAGMTWGRPVPGFDGDKPWMTIDRTNGTGRGNIYVTVGGDFARSTDGGLSFSGGKNTGGGLLGSLTVDVHGAALMTQLAFYVVKTSNAHDPTTEPIFEDSEIDLGGFIQFGPDPNPAGLLDQSWIDSDHSDGLTRGNVYVLSSVEIPSGDPAEVHFIRSEDGGETWSPPLRVNDDPEGNGAYQWFASMSVAPNGRIDAVWNDTRNYPGVEFSRLCELYYSFSTDAGETWSTNVPVSPVFDSHVGWPGFNRKLGDYYHTRSDNLGVNVAYAATFNGEQDVYFLRIGPWDCNSNEIPDEDDIASETSLDCNGNEIPDECEMLGDFDGNGRVNLTDVAAFQNCYTGPLAPPLLAKEGLGEVSSRRFTPLNTPSTTGEADGSPRRTRRVLFERRRHHGMKGEADGSPRRMRRQTFSRSRAVGYDAATESAFIGPCCSRFDFNDDGAIDTADYALLRPALRWPDRQEGR